MATTLKYSEVRAWLEAQPENTASTPYEIIITAILESNFSLNFSGRYVAIAGLEMQSGETKLGPIFFNCRTLVGSVTIPEGVTVIGRRAFAGCPGLTNVNIPNSVTTIAGDAFWSCPGLTSINIPDSVTTIANGAFRDSINLASVAIPDGATNVYYDAFVGCTSLQYIDTYYLPTKSGRTFLCKKIPKDATSFNVRDDCVGISAGAAWNCTSLAGISIPGSVKTIGEMAFKACTALSRFTIPGSVTFMGKNIFQGCTGLTRVDLATGVTYISDYAFDGCTKLAVVNINNSTLTTIGSFAFQGCISMGSFVIPDSVKVLGENAFKGCTGLTIVSIPSSVKTIGKQAFRGCTGLSNVYMYPDFSSTLMQSNSFSDTPSTLNLYVTARKLPGWQSAPLTNYGFASGVVAKMLPSRKWIRIA